MSKKLPIYEIKFDENSSNGIDMIAITKYPDFGVDWKICKNKKRKKKNKNKWK